MFKTTQWLIALHMVGVISVVVTLLVLTLNPLSLLGLLLMPQVPLVQQAPDQDTDARGIGFTADMGEDDDE